MNKVCRAILLSSYFLVLHFKPAYAQEPVAKIKDFDHVAFLDHPSFLFISTDSIFKKNKLRKEFKFFLKPFINEFRLQSNRSQYDYNLYLSLGLFENGANDVKHLENVKKIGKLFNYLIRRTKSKGYIFNALTFQEDYTKIDRAEFFKKAPLTNCVTFNFRTLAKTKP